MTGVDSIEVPDDHNRTFHKHSLVGDPASEAGTTLPGEGSDLIQESASRSLMLGRVDPPLAQQGVHLIEAGTETAR